MSHYPDQYQADIDQQNQRKIRLFYKNKLNGISMVVEMIEQELKVPIINENKINHMLRQIKCLSEE